MDKFKSFLENRKNIKIISLTSILVGFLLCGLGFTLVDNDIYALNPNPVEIVSKEKTVPLDDISFINVDVKHSDVMIERTEGDQILLQYEEKKDRPLIIDIERNNLTIYSEPKVEIFSFNWMNIDKNGRPNFKLMVPKKFSGDLFITNTYGPISVNNIKGIKEFRIYNNHGEINANDIQSTSVTIENTYGLIKVSDMKSNGGVSVINNHNGIFVKNIEADSMILDNSYGSIVCNDLLVKNNFNLGTQHNDVNIQNITAKTFFGYISYGYLEVDTMKLEDEFRLTNEHNDVNLKNVQSKTSSIEVKYGNVTLKDWMSDDIMLEVKHGDILGDILGVEADYHIISNVEHGESNLANERNEGKANKLDVTLSYGDLEINFNK